MTCALWLTRCCTIQTAAQCRSPSSRTRSTLSMPAACHLWVCYVCAAKVPAATVPGTAGKPKTTPKAPKKTTPKAKPRKTPPKKTPKSKPKSKPKAKPAPKKQPKAAPAHKKAAPAKKKASTGHSSHAQG